MPEPTRPRFGSIPDAPADGYVVEEGAAKGFRSHLTAEHLYGIRCNVCGGRAEMGKDGRLRFVHDSAKHFALGGGAPSASAIMAQPIKREEESRAWWDSE